MTGQTAKCEDPTDFLVLPAFGLCKRTEKRFGDLDGPGKVVDGLGSC